MSPDARVATPAVESLPEPIAAALRMIAIRALSDEEDARDAVQETLARALEAVRTGAVPAGVPLSAFIHGIARHVIADTLRRRMRDRGADPEVDRLVAPAPSPLDQLIQREERTRVQRALARLPARDRDLLRRCFVDGQRLVDIATQLGESAESVRKRKSRALEQLRELLRSAPPAGHVSPPDPTLVP